MYKDKEKERQEYSKKYRQQNREKLNEYAKVYQSLVKINLNYVDFNLFQMFHLVD